MIEFIYAVFVPTAYVCMVVMIVTLLHEMWTLHWRNHSCERCRNLIHYVIQLERELHDARGAISTARRSGGDDEGDHRHLPEPPAA
jgi:hypothetical protein